MDLLSLTFRSLNLGGTMSQRDDFLNAEKKELHERSNVTMEKRRKLKLNEEESPWRVGKEHSRELRKINLDEVAWHDTADNCWLVIYDYVYDCTEFLKNHPGGSDILLEYAGRDSTLSFIGTGHSHAAQQSLERYLIGELPPEERIFRVADGIKIPIS